MWLTKSGASIWSNASRSALPSCASKKRRTRALFSSSTGMFLSSWHVRGTSRTHGATALSAAHRSEAYSPECVEEEFCELRRDGVLGSSALPWCSDVLCALAHIYL